MSKTNLVLLVVLIVLANVYFLNVGGETETSTGPAPRLFPSFNKEAADLIVIEGGWKERPYVFARLGSAWHVASGGGFLAKAETADKLLDAIWNLRKENAVSDSLEVRKGTRTDEGGRLVRIFTGGREGEPMAAFRIGKSPEGSYDVFFVRADQGETVYRTRTILTEDQRKGGPDPWDQTEGAAKGFGWDNYLQSLSQWVETRVWNLGDAEEAELMLVRPGDKFNIKLVKHGQDDWQLTEKGKEPVAADVDAVRGLTGQIRYLGFEEVVGTFDDVAADYGLTEPQITLVMTLKKAIEKPAEEETVESDSEGSEGTEEGTEKEGEPAEAEEPKEKYKTFTRFIEVGKKVSIAKFLDDETGEPETKEFYAIRVGGDFDKPEEEELSKFVYLVSDYTIGGLRKTLDELVVVEEGDTEGIEGGDSGSTEGTEEGAEEPAKEEEPAKDEEPAKEEPAKEDEPEEKTGD